MIINTENGRGIVPVKEGGTGAENAAEALKNLGFQSPAEVIERAASMADIGTLSWDGDITGLEVVETKWYKVSDATPSYEELQNLSKITQTGGERVTLDGSSVTIENNADGYCYMHYAYFELARVYYEGNAAGVSPGTYFWLTDSWDGLSNYYQYTTRLTIENYIGFEENLLKPECLPKIPMEKLPNSGISAGTYGGYDPSNAIYNIPNITADKYGRITRVSYSALGLAGEMNNGLFPFEYYAALKNIPVLQSITGTITAGNTAVRAWYFAEDKIGGRPFVIHMYGKYNDGVNDIMIPLKWRGSSSGTGYYITALLDEAIDYDLTVYMCSNITPYAGSM